MRCNSFFSGEIFTEVLLKLYSYTCLRFDSKKEHFQKNILLKNYFNLNKIRKVRIYLKIYFINICGCSELTLIVFVITLYNGLDFHKS